MDAPGAPSFCPVDADLMPLAFYTSLPLHIIWPSFGVLVELIGDGVDGFPCTALNFTCVKIELSTIKHNQIYDS